MNTLAARTLATLAAFMLSAASIGAIVTVPPTTVSATAAPVIA